MNVVVPRLPMPVMKYGGIDEQVASSLALAEC
jgi:hypothetical protein